MKNMTIVLILALSLSACFKPSSVSEECYYIARNEIAPEHLFWVTDVIPVEGGVKSGECNAVVKAVSFPGSVMIFRFTATYKNYGDEFVYEYSKQYIGRDTVDPISTIPTLEDIRDINDDYNSMLSEDDMCYNIVWTVATTGTIEARGQADCPIPYSIKLWMRADEY